MDIEFHYYITHLVAARAGFRGTDLSVLTYSSQFTDDNDREYKIRMGRNLFYNNRISQTMDILKPQPDRLAIYPLFHFIPGDPLAASASRVDGAIRACNTTANSAYANQIMDESLKTNDLHQIGIATHAYVDTWAHQNFVGYHDRFNGLLGRLKAIIPSIGHADSRHQPDWSALPWPCLTPDTAHCPWRSTTRQLCWSGWRSRIGSVGGDAGPRPQGMAPA